MEEEKDVFRDTWIRYFGYSNEVGESFRPVLDVSTVRASYALAFLYVVADTADKTWKAKEKGLATEKVALAGGDAFVWQCLASIALPGLAINRISAASWHVLKRYPQIPGRTWLTVGIGLASIPVIIKPIDKFCDFLMDKTYRRVLPVYNVPKIEPGSVVLCEKKD